MRLNVVLHKIHLYRMIKQHWKVQRKKNPIETNSEKTAKERGLEVVDINDVVKNEIQQERLKIIGVVDLPLVKDENHPLYNRKPCYTYGDHNVLLYGIDQASVLCNSIVINDLPPQFDKKIDEEIMLPDNVIQRCIKSSLLYDAEQKKLPKRKDPERPAWNFPRDYGITYKRKNHLLSSRLLQLCALSLNNKKSLKSIIQDAMFSVPLVIDSNQVQLEIRADVLLTSSSPLPCAVDPDYSSQFPIPDISPLHPLVSLQEDNIYQLQDIFPLKPGSHQKHVHTAILHYNETEVKNIYETPVTDSQVLSRSLVKSYAIAVAQAKHNYGAQIKDLPEPITIQTIQTNGQVFIFSVFQLNTLSLNGNIHNIFWSKPMIKLFSCCEYIEGKPVLQDFNSEVFQRMVSFYHK
uniref:Large ribosomal subunit protein mL37 n=1 Tax=Clastoptera arizonana TaxID=38151 RepID=A0A1B6DL06_9HEMI